jgi:hypothetical protein
MPGVCTLGIVSDIHYACAVEKARGLDYEVRGIRNPLLRLAVRLYRRWIWLRDPMGHNELLDSFLAQAGNCDYAIANGDYSCNSGFIGVADPAACQSINECLGKLRQHFGARLRVTFGDHELGKVSFFGGQGGMRLASWRAAREQAGLEPFWRLDIGRYALFGVVSSLIALPVFEPDTLPEELPEWQRLRQEHVEIIRAAFAGLKPDRRILLFCHDPSALPFLGRIDEVRDRFPQLERTVIGHLHSGLILWKAKLLAGMPRITFLGHTARRLSTALRAAREWRPFHVLLCPSLAGVELLKDGGFYTAELQPDASPPCRFKFHPLKR